MKKTAFDEVTSIHNCCANVLMQRHLVNHKPLQNFSYMLTRFQGILGDYRGDNYWRKVFKLLKEHRYRMCATPLAFDILLRQLRASEDVLVEQLCRRCGDAYPMFAEKATTLYEKYNKLLQYHENPLLDAILEIQRTIPESNVAILVRESSLVPETSLALQKCPQLIELDVVIPQMLSKGRCYNRLIALGPADWFPDFVFSSPRSALIHLVHYSWINDRWQLLPSLTCAKYSPIGPHGAILPYIAPKAGKHFVDAYVINAEDLTPRIDWDSLYEMVRSHGNTAEGVNQAEVLIFVLEGGNYVLMNVEAGSSSLIIDLLSLSEDDEDENNAVVQRIPTLDIEPGMFLLLRTRGSGDYVVSLADTILGKHADYCNRIQKKWKFLLLKEVEETSMLSVAVRLLDLGSEFAKEQNVRNWISESNIRPRHKTDFTAIMRLIGLEAETDEYWKAATEIDHAHRRAGHEIRKLLLKNVLNSNLTELEKYGRMDFILEQVDGGSITAFRVKEVSEEHFIVPVHCLGHVFLEMDEPRGE